MLGKPPLMGFDGGLLGPHESGVGWVGLWARGSGPFIGFAERYLGIMGSTHIFSIGSSTSKVYNQPTLYLANHRDRLNIYLFSVKCTRILGQFNPQDETT